MPMLGLLRLNCRAISNKMPVPLAPSLAAGTGLFLFAGFAS